MRTVSIRLEDLAKMTVKIGFVGENEHTRVCIDCKKAFDEYPGAVATLTVQPPAGEAYPDVTTRDGDTVIWDVEDHDLTDEGEGEFQLSFVVDETVMKSYIGRTAICRSIVPTGDVPEAIDDWLTRANAALAEIPIEIAEALEEAKESGEFDGRGISDAVLNSDYTLTLYFTDGTSYTTPSIKGGQGEPGFSPTITVTEITGGHRLTITDVEGTQTVDILDGEKGDTGNGIAYCVLNQDYTLTITYTDGRRYTTQSIRGAQGAQGEPGATGETGATPIITIGTVSTLAPGSDATASMDTTDPEHPVLSLGIPEGEPGEVTDAELQAVAESKADVITESITTPASVQTIPDGGNGFPMGLEIEIDPVQDLHGYEYPWVGGAGKNVLPPVQAKTENGLTCTVSVDGVVTINGTASATTTFEGAVGDFEWDGTSQYWLSGCPAGGNVQSGYSLRVQRSDGYTYSQYDTGSGVLLAQFDSRTLANNKLLFCIVIRSGVVCNNLKFYPMLEAGTAKTSYEPYSNICPITGHTGVDAVRTGAYTNQWDEQYELGIYDSTTGEKTDSTTQLRCKNAIPVTASTSYYFNIPSGMNFRILYYKTDGTYISSEIKQAGTFTTPALCKYVRFHFAAGYGTTYVNNISINYPATDTSYHSAPTYPITFPSEAGTVYGCTFRFKKDGTGVLTDNRCYVKVKDLSVFNVVNSKRAIFSLSKSSPSVNIAENGLISNSIATGNYSTADGDYAFMSTTVRITINLTTEVGSTASDWDTWKANCGYEFCYILSSPVTYNLTAEQCALISSLLGTNNIWADTGDILSVDYSADTKLYINKAMSASKRLMELIVTANREDSMKATKAYSANDLLIVNGTLYKATTSIANGATLTAGTNVTASTVAAEIAAIS